MISGAGVHCPHDGCHAAIGIASIQVQVENQLRAAISKFYEGWLVCDDASCGNRTRMLSVVGRRCLKADCRGRMHNEVSVILESLRKFTLTNVNLKYTDARLYNQMLYFLSLFDTENARLKTLGTARAGKQSFESMPCGFAANFGFVSDEIAALKAQNELSFGQVTTAVDAYMKKCGRRYVSLDSVFSYMNVSR